MIQFFKNVQFFFLRNEQKIDNILVLLYCCRFPTKYEFIKSSVFEETTKISFNYIGYFRRQITIVRSMFDLQSDIKLCGNVSRSLATDSIQRSFSCVAWQEHSAKQYMFGSGTTSTRRLGIVDFILAEVLVLWSYGDTARLSCGVFQYGRVERGQYVQLREMQ